MLIDDDGPSCQHNGSLVTDENESVTVVSITLNNNATLTLVIT